jgi:hypothetical protein
MVASPGLIQVSVRRARARPLPPDRRHEPIERRRAACVASQAARASWPAVSKLRTYPRVSDARALPSSEAGTSPSNHRNRPGCRPPLRRRGGVHVIAGERPGDPLEVERRAPVTSSPRASDD